MSIAVGARGFTLNMVETSFSKTVEHKPFKGSELLSFGLQKDAQIPPMIFPLKTNWMHYNWELVNTMETSETSQSEQEE